jgi:glycosyltransferase involved in cell wall biosynthesis
MKILFLTPWYPNFEKPYRGVFIRDQAVALARGNSVCLVYADIDYSSFGILSFRKTESTYQGISEIKIIVKKSFPVFNQINFFITVIWSSVKIARNINPDILHGNISYPGAFWSWAVSKSVGKPFVITEHSKLNNHFRSFFHKWISTFFLKRANAVITVSSFSANIIREYTKIEAKVVPNIIHFNRFNIGTVRQKEESISIGFLGGLDTEVKGLGLLLKALSKVSFPYILKVGGEGKLLESYKKSAVSLGISRHCFFLGKIENQKISSFMHEIDFFVSASQFETFGIVIAEAIASGIPVIVTESGGPQDFVSTINGVVIKNNDVEELSNALNKMSKRFNLYNPQKMREEIERRFSSETVVKQLMDVYTQVLAQSVA